MREQTQKNALALGTFDGVHRGHRAVLEAARQFAPELTPGAVYFETPPAGGPVVETPEDREERFDRMGLTARFPLAFDRVRDLGAAEFVRRGLLDRCRAGALCCGEDFRFGKDAQGGPELLADLCREAGVALRVLPPVADAGGKISSTRIRRAVEAGDVAGANRLLGRPFGFAGTVIHGNHLGTGMGTPTLNQAYPAGLATPRFGVYACWCRTPRGDWYGVTNIGRKPTVGSDRILAETWLPDFSGDLYGQRVRLFLLGFIRPERKFASLEELRQVIVANGRQAADIARGQPLAGWPAEELLGC